MPMKRFVESVGPGDPLTADMFRGVEGITYDPVGNRFMSGTSNELRGQ